MVYRAGPWMRAVAMACAIIGPRAHAQAPAAPEPVSQDLQTLTHESLKRQMPGGFAAFFRQDQTLRLTRQQLDSAKAEQFVEDIVMPEFEPALPELESAMAELWTRRFTPKEIHELVVGLVEGTPAQKKSFPDTPLGQKYIGRYPVIVSERTERIRDWITRHMRAALANNRERVRELGINPTTGDRMPASAN